MLFSSALSSSRGARRVFASVLLGSFLLPSVMQAAGTSVTIMPANGTKAVHLIQGEQRSPVTRGDFLRSSMKALRFQVASYTKLKPFPRTPDSLKPYVNTAYALGALKVFGRQLNAARPITRSEAIQILVGLVASGETARE